MPWASQPPRTTEMGDRNFEEQWVYMNKLPQGPWSNDVNKESPDPLGSNEDQRQASNEPFNMDDYHDPALYAAHENAITIHHARSASPVPDDPPAYDATKNLEGFGTTSSLTLTMITTFPSYKGQPANSHTPLELHEADEVTLPRIKHEADD